jgi:hypothetical protein
MKQRVYTVGLGDQVRLIRAQTRRQAVAYVSRTLLNVRVATQDDLIEQLTKGVPIENYRDPDQIELDI